MRCHQCAVESPLADLFVRRRRSFSKNGPSLCPRCARRRKDTSAIVTVVIAAAILSVFLIMWLRGSVNPAWDDWNWIRDGALFFAFELICIVPHELAHAAAGRLMGLDIGRITFGRGALLARLVIRGVILDLRAIPIVGSVSGTTRRLTNWRWRMIAYIAAGPIANLILMIVSTVVWFTSPGPGLAGSRAMSPWMLLALANFALLANALWARDVTTAWGKMPSDGRQLLRLLFKPLPEPKVRQRQYFQVRALWLFDLDQNDQMLAVLNEGLQELPSDTVLRGLKAIALVGLRQYEAAREILLALLNEHKDRDAQWAMLNNNLAWADLMSERAEWLLEADVASAHACGLLPWVASVESTRGVVLVETGRVDEGIRLLKRALAGADRPASKASILCSLAIAECYRGDLPAARLLAARARRYSPDCEALPRVQKLLSAAQDRVAVVA